MSTTELPLTGEVALVMGASSGLGRATAGALARAAAPVGLLARSAPDLASVTDALRAAGHRFCTCSRRRLRRVGA
jgi:NADP-dependent 3-hydroxy acid dehydrogenase YdfG